MPKLTPRVTVRVSRPAAEPSQQSAEPRPSLLRWPLRLMAAGAATGLVVLLNRLAEVSTERAEPALDGDHSRFAWAHGDIFYTVRGRGEPLLLVHGIYIGASSREYERVFNTLAERYRVYAIDLLGFGLSERPPLRYTPQLYIDLIDDFVRHVMGGADHPVHVVATSLSAAFVTRAAANRPSLFDHLVLVEPTGVEQLAGEASAPLRRALRVVLATPVLGEAIYNLVSARPSVRVFLQAAYGPHARVTDDIVDEYMLMAHLRGARFAIASFFSGNLSLDIGSALEQVQQRVLLLWGRHARFTPVRYARAFQQACPNSELRVLDAGSLPQAELPDEFVAEVMRWVPAAQRSRRG